MFKTSLHTGKKTLITLLLLLLFSLSSCASTTGLFGGGRWQSGGLSHQHIRALAVDPNNPQIIYAGDTQQGVFVSSDAAQSWTQRSTGLPLPLAVNALSFDAAGTKLYAATDIGLFVTADAAQHWQAVALSETALPTDSYTSIAIDYGAQHTLYAGTLHHGALVSTDSGATWTSVASGLPSDAAVNGLTFETNQHQLWAATSMGIFRFDSGETSWQAFNTGLPANVMCYTVQPSFSGSGTQERVFAGTDHGVFISQDHGVHWAVAINTLSSIKVRAVFIDFTSKDSSTIYAGTDFGVFRSDDSGQTWQAFTSGWPASQPVYDMTLGATNYTQLFAASNDIYEFPGDNGGWSLSRLLPVILILLFFFILYRFLWRNRGSRKQLLKSEPDVEPKTSGAQILPTNLPELRIRKQEGTATNNHHASQGETVDYRIEEMDS